ncbi:MAG: hypothetical protein IH624_19165 [Phycisphaerae bacterium]|nr:hypothetical protein [Phycisphaerae bacterium]
MVSCIAKRLCITVVLCTAACASAAQYPNSVFAPLPHEVSMFDSALRETSAYVSTSAVGLADAGAQLLEANACLHPFSGCANASARRLPAAPPALLLTLFGFCCVSLIRDRRAWLTFAGALMCLGQVGTHPASQLACSIRARSLRQSTAHACFCFSDKLMMEPAGRGSEITSAAPRKGSRQTPGRMATRAANLSVPAGVHGQPVAMEAIQQVNVWPDGADACLPGITRRLIISSPVFAFMKPARGPPAIPLQQ